MNKFDRAIEKLEKEGLNVMWAIPVDVLIDTFGFCKNNEHKCTLCNKNQTPLVGFYFITEEKETVVGYICDHLECERSKITYNHTTMIHIDEDSLFNKEIKSLFENNVNSDLH